LTKDFDVLHSKITEREKEKGKEKLTLLFSFVFLEWNLIEKKGGGFID